MMHFTPAQLQQAGLMAVREQCRRSLAHFTREAWHVLEPATELKWGWALDAICSHLEAVSRGEIKRLVINVPPGSMKSLLAGVFWNAWEWGPCGRPEMRFLSTAHKQDLAVRDTMKARRLIQSQWFQKRWPLGMVSDNNQKLRFENSSTGFREAMAFTSLTGSRADRVILDDPHSVDDAYSPTLLFSAVRTFREALPSRVNNEDSAIVIIMQRLHESDVTNAALELGYEHLCIPMRFEPDHRCSTTLGWSDPRELDGELMFPERFPADQVEELEASLGSYAAAGQLQQRPAPREGGMFKRRWFEIVDAAPAGLEECRGWDFAGTVARAGSDPDWTAGVKIGRSQSGFYYILDTQRFREASAYVERSLLSTTQQDGKICKVRIPQDPGQAGKGQASTFTRLLTGYMVRAVPPTGSKELRAAAFAAQCEAGNVKVVKGLWNEEFFDEIEVFPFGKHDDQIDAAADAFNELNDGTASAGFLAMVREDNAEAERLKEKFIANGDEPDCPYQKGSMEYLRFKGLIQ